jgi:hypothetical protein
MKYKYAPRTLLQAQNARTIFRRELSPGKFGTFPREIFDLGLSLEAVGLLIYLLDRPVIWRVIPEQLRDKFGSGKHKIYGLIDELRRAGFIHGSKLKDGTYRYAVFDQPTKPDLENQDQGPKPDPENRDQGPDPENPDQGFGHASLKRERDSIQTDSRKGLETERGAPAARGTTLPPDWAPSEFDEAYGQQLGFSREQISSMAEDMRLWAGANANRQVARKADWSLTFKHWMRRAQQKTQRWHRPHEKGFAEIANDIRNGHNESPEEYYDALGADDWTKH